jgi:hypothetical protein
MPDNEQAFGCGFVAGGCGWRQPFLVVAPAVAYAWYIREAIRPPNSLYLAAGLFSHAFKQHKTGGLLQLRLWNTKSYLR